MLITGISTGISISGLLLIILYAYLKAHQIFFFLFGISPEESASNIISFFSSSLKYSVFYYC